MNEKEVNGADSTLPETKKKAPKRRKVHKEKKRYVDFELMKILEQKGFDRKNLKAKIEQEKNEKRERKAKKKISPPLPRQQIIKEIKEQVNPIPKQPPVETSSPKLETGSPEITNIIKQNQPVSQDIQIEEIYEDEAPKEEKKENFIEKLKSKFAKKPENKPKDIEKTTPAKEETVIPEKTAKPEEEAFPVQAGEKQSKQPNIIIPEKKKGLFARIFKKKEDSLQDLESFSATSKDNLKLEDASSQKSKEPIELNPEQKDEKNQPSSSSIDILFTEKKKKVL